MGTQTMSTNTDTDTTTDGPSIDKPLLDALADELREATSKDTAKTAADLADAVGIEDTEASPKTREAIKTLLRHDEYDLPIRSCHAGYYILTTQSELEEYLDNLDGRIAGIEERKELITAAYKQRQRGGGDE